MPQQPKITGDAQEDSWALQVTQELNAIPTVYFRGPRLPNAPDNVIVGAFFYLERRPEDTTVTPTVPAEDDALYFGRINAAGVRSWEQIF